MKILVLENEPSSRRGGQEWCLLDTCRGLAQCGHEIHLVYNKDGDFLKSYQEFCRSLVKVHCFRINLNNPLTSSIAWLSSIIQSLRLSPDLIYANHHNDTFFAGTLAQLKGVPLVCHLHVFPSPRFSTQSSMGLKSVTRFIAVSEATRTAYVQAGLAAETIEVVYNGIDLKRFALKHDRQQTRQLLGVSPEAFVVLYAGRIDPPKNIEMLLAAFARLGFPASRARLLIAGRPVNHVTPEAGERYVRSLKSLGESLAISNSVHWLGSRSDLPEVFRAADVTVLPSMLPDTFGRVLAESMACGTPALGLRYGGIPEVLSDEFERFQIEVGDLEGLTNLLRSVDGWQYKDPTLGQRCRAYVEQRFPVERTVEEVERVLKQAASLGALRLGPSLKTLRAWNGEGTEMSEKS
jgi:glycosyltransferase involved in cell wall biosynthesis